MYNGDVYPPDSYFCGGEMGKCSWAVEYSPSMEGFMDQHSVKHSRHNFMNKVRGLAASCTASLEVTS